MNRVLINNNCINQKKSMTNKILYISLSILITVFFFYQGLDLFGIPSGEIYKISGDSDDYINSVESLKKGDGFIFFKTSEDKEFVSNFIPDGENNKSIFYTFRSPGFAFFYYPLRFILSKENALISILILQILLTALAKYLIAEVGLIITKKKWVFYGLFSLINLTPYFVQYNNLLLTEAFGFSFLVFSIYVSIKAFYFESVFSKKRFNMLLFLGGFYLTISLMLRPFLAVFLLLMGIFILLRNRDQFKRAITVGVIYFSSFIIIDGIWLVRNFVHTNEIIPLAETFKFQDHKHKAFQPMRIFSLDHKLSDRWFNKSSPVYWLVNENDSRNLSDLLPELSEVEMKWFTQFKKDFYHSLDLSVPLKERQKLEVKLEQSLIAYNNDFKNENYFDVKFVTPVERTIGLLNKGNLRFFHHIKYPLNVAFVSVQSFILSLTFLCGTIALILSIFVKEKTGLYRYFAIGALFLILYFGWIEGITERRELYTYSGIFLISVFVLLAKLQDNIKKARFILVLCSFFILSIISGIQKVFEEINW